jgi:hypothetical protein
MFNKLVELSNKYVILGREFCPDFAGPYSLHFYENYPILTIHPFELWFTEHKMKFNRINIGEYDERKSRLNACYIGEKHD